MTPHSAQRRRLQTMLVAFLALVSVGCGILDGDPDTAERLADARRLWARRGLEDYAYTYRRSCECAPEATRAYRITVRGGTIVGVADEATGVAAAEGYGLTVEALFALVEEAIDRPADRLSVSFDPEWGFPATLSVDDRLEIADDEFTVHAGALEPLS